MGGTRQQLLQRSKPLGHDFSGSLELVMNGSGKRNPQLPRPTEIGGDHRSRSHAAGTSRVLAPREVGGKFVLRLCD